MTFEQTAALFADRTRAAMCLALLDGRAWTAGELGRTAGVAASTASEHLSKLVEGGVLVEERQGRHRYVRLADPEVAVVIEGLYELAEKVSGKPIAKPPRNLRESLRMSAEARARTCYDHLAGRLGVAVADALLERGVVTDEAGLAVTERGLEWLEQAGVRLPAKTRGRPMVRPCLDWTERRTHLGGVVGAALCTAAFERKWVERGAGRALRVTAAGEAAFRELLGVEMPPVAA